MRSDPRLLVWGALGLVACGVALALSPGARSADVIRDHGRIYIVDRRGERWDVTRAVRELGFAPERFRHGIGRDAFQPLDESALRDRPGQSWGDDRVIGIERDGEAQAYSVRRLVGHEIANTKIGDDPIAAAY